MVLVAVGLVLSSVVYADWRATWNALALALASTLVAALICLPWLIGVVSAGRGAVAVFGVPIPASDATSWGSLLRFAVGPIGASPLAWGFAVAAVVPLALARGERFRWAGRLWSIALVFWFMAWATGRGWTGTVAIDPLVLLGPAAAAVAAAIGLGVAAFEEDLRAADFGWRQLVTVIATGAVVLGAAPTLAAALPGRWDLPINDFSQSVAWMHGKAAAGSFRVLWLGDTRSLNQGSWSAGDGLAYATSDDGAPDARWLWNAASPGPATGLASAVSMARANRTDQLGRMLAPAGVRYVVLLTSLAPEIIGEQTPQVYPVAGDLAPALDRQLDLSPVVSVTGITVYANADWIPVRTEVPSGTVHRAKSVPGPGVLANPLGSGTIPGAVPVLPGPAASRSYAGPLSPGTVLAALAPAGRWSLNGPTGHPARRSSSFGWAASYRVTTAGVSTLRFEGGLVSPASLLYSIIVWVAALALLSGRLGAPWRRAWTGRRRSVPGQRRHHRVTGRTRWTGRPGGGRRRDRGRPMTEDLDAEEQLPGPTTTSLRRPRHALRPVRGRWTAIVSVVVVVIGVAVIDAVVPVSSATPPPVSGDGVPVAPAGAYSSSAFCSAGIGTVAEQHDLPDQLHASPDHRHHDLDRPGQRERGGSHRAARRYRAAVRHGRSRSRDRASRREQLHVLRLRRSGEWRPARSSPVPTAGPRPRAHRRPPPGGRSPADPRRRGTRSRSPCSIRRHRRRR